jgi:hypothetical protein
LIPDLRHLRPEQPCISVQFGADCHANKTIGGKPILTDFIVAVNANPEKVVVKFATLHDMSFVLRWRETLGANPKPTQRDAVDFAELARERFIADSKLGQPYIETLGKMQEHIARDPKCEVAGFMLLKCDWFYASQVIGICHFRRTWCNNIVLDYLATHPLTLGETEDTRHKVKGIGTVLLCCLSRIAIENSCELIWGEATDRSCGYYEKLFELEVVKDLIVVPRDNFTLCANRKLDWQGNNDVNTMNLGAVRELYEIEKTHPPLVGKRTIMAGSRRQLVDHFLDLPRHVQNEIAQTLGLLKEGDSHILEDQWCRILFQRADQNGKLHELWNEVEKRHDDGEPEKNPFVR